MIIINSRFLTQKITGVQRYALEICNNLPKFINNHKVVFVAPKNNLINKEYLKDIEIIEVGRFQNNLWEQIDLVTFLKKHNNPLLINFGGIGPVFYKNKIMYIHDLAFKYYPEYFSYSFQKSYNLLIPISIKNTKKVLTVSNYVKEDLKSVLKIKHADVLYPSYNSAFKDLNLKREKIILAVSSIDPRKNIMRVIEAYTKLKTDYKLVFVGAKSNSFASLKLNEVTKNSNIIFTGYLSDQEIISYYNKASIFIYASTFEGFGIPPLEAQACGCPCIVSNVTSLPEVFADSVAYCDPFSVESIQEKLKLLIENEVLRESLRASGKNNIQRFSWKKSSDKLVEFIKKEIQ